MPRCKMVFYLMIRDLQRMGIETPKSARPKDDAALSDIDLEQLSRVKSVEINKRSESVSSPRYPLATIKPDFTFIHLITTRSGQFFI